MDDVLEVSDRFGVPRCEYHGIAVYPTLSQITSMIEAECSFKLNGKRVARKKIKEMIQIYEDKDKE